MLSRIQGAMTMHLVLRKRKRKRRKGRRESIRKRRRRMQVKLQKGRMKPIWMANILVIRRPQKLRMKMMVVRAIRILRNR